MLESIVAVSVVDHNKKVLACEGVCETWTDIPVETVLQLTLGIAV